MGTAWLSATLLIAAALQVGRKFIGVSHDQLFSYFAFFPYLTGLGVANSIFSVVSIS